MAAARPGSCPPARPARSAAGTRSSWLGAGPAPPDSPPPPRATPQAASYSAAAQLRTLTSRGPRNRGNSLGQPCEVQTRSPNCLLADSDPSAMPFAASCHATRFVRFARLATGHRRALRHSLRRRPALRNRARSRERRRCAEPPVVPRRRDRRRARAHVAHEGWRREWHAPAHAHWHDDLRHVHRRHALGPGLTGWGPQEAAGHGRARASHR